MLTNDRVIGILLAHLGAFGSGELKISNLFLFIYDQRPEKTKYIINIFNRIFNIHISYATHTDGQSGTCTSI